MLKKKGKKINKAKELSLYTKWRNKYLSTILEQNKRNETEYEKELERRKEQKKEILEAFTKVPSITNHERIEQGIQNIRGTKAEFLKFKKREKRVKKVIEISAKKEYDRIKKITTSLLLDSDRIIFCTKPIICQEVLIGSYKVSLSCLSMFPAITSVEHPNALYPHPNIEEYDPCLGDYRDILDTAYYNGDIFSYLLILRQYLETGENGHYDFDTWRDEYMGRTEEHDSSE